MYGDARQLAHTFGVYKQIYKQKRPVDRGVWREGVDADAYAAGVTFTVCLLSAPLTAKLT